MDTTTIILAITAGVVGLTLIAIAVAIVLLARHNRAFSRELRRLVDNNVALLEAAASQQADAARGMMEQLRQEAAVATMPVLVLLDEPPLGIRDQPWAAVRVRNVGNGSALNFVVWMRLAGHLYHSAGAEAKGFSQDLHLAVGDTFEPGPFQNMLFVGDAHGYLDPGAAVVGDDPSANLVAYCGDAVGNRFRYNLRTGDPAGLLGARRGCALLGRCVGSQAVLWWSGAARSADGMGIGFGARHATACRCAPRRPGRAAGRDRGTACRLDGTCEPAPSRDRTRKRHRDRPVSVLGLVTSGRISQQRRSPSAGSSCGRREAPL